MERRSNKRRIKKYSIKVEEMTINYKESTIYNNIPQLRSLFFNKDEQTASDYLLDKLKDNIDKDIVRSMDTYTLETIFIWVLSKHFNVFAIEDNSVRLAALIEELDKNVRLHLDNTCAIYNSNDTSILDKENPEYVVEITVQGEPAIDDESNIITIYRNNHGEEKDLKGNANN